MKVRVNHAPSGETWDVLKESTFPYNSTNQANELVFSVPYDTDVALLNFSSTKKDANGADSLSLGNIVVEKVAAVLNDASRQSVLFTNTTEAEKTINLADTIYRDIEGKEVSNSLTLPPFSSKILTYVSGKTPPTLGNLTAPVLRLSLNAKTVSVDWDEDKEAEGYRLYYAPKPYQGEQSIKFLEMKNKKQFSIELPSGSAFYVAVKSYNKLGESNYSNIESFIIP